MGKISWREREEGKRGWEVKGGILGFEDAGVDE